MPSRIGKRLEIFLAANKILEDEQPMTALYNPTDLWLVKPNVKGCKHEGVLDSIISARRASNRRERWPKTSRAAAGADVGYLSRRTLAAVPTLLLVYTLVFFIAHVTPGSPWDIGSNRPVEPTVKAALDAKYHLDEPLRRNMSTISGRAAWRSRPVLSRPHAERQRHHHRIPAGLAASWARAAMLLAILLGLPLGALAALTRHPAIDGLIRMLSTLGISMPTYVVTSILIVVLGVGLGWVPTFGWKAFSRPRPSCRSSRWRWRRSPPSSAISATACSR